MDSPLVPNCHFESFLHELMEVPCQSILSSIDFGRFISNQTVVFRNQYGRGYFAASIGDYHQATGKFECDTNPKFFYFTGETGAKGMMESSLWEEIWKVVGDCVESGTYYQQPIVFLLWGERNRSAVKPYHIAIRAHILDLSGRI